MDERRDPEKSARAAARYLKQLHAADRRLAPRVGRLQRRRRAGSSRRARRATTTSGRWPRSPGKKVLRAETKGYVPKLMAAAIITKHPEAFGFRADEIEPQRWDEYAEVTIPSATLLGVVARAAGVSERQLIDLNPELRRACTPPRPYQLKIPKGAGRDVRPELARDPGQGPDDLRRATSSAAATRSPRSRRSYGVPTEGIMEMNGLRSAKKLRVGHGAHHPEADRRRSASRRARRSLAGEVAARRRPGGRDEAPRAEPARREPSRRTWRPPPRADRSRTHAARAGGGHALVDLAPVRRRARRAVPLERDRQPAPTQAARRRAARRLRRARVRPGSAQGRSRPAALRPRSGRDGRLPAPVRLAPSLAARPHSRPRRGSPQAACRRTGSSERVVEGGQP